MSLLFACCATFTKEQGITVLGVLVVYELLFISKCNLAHPMTALKKVRFVALPLRQDIFD